MNRAPSQCWSLRRERMGLDYVCTTNDDGIYMQVGPDGMLMSRADARLLAKRINQCLDGTAKR